MASKGGPVTSGQLTAGPGERGGAGATEEWLAPGRILWRQEVPMLALGPDAWDGLT
jgi:hypothetical protein